jgi:2-desacetyl-2-hydroxyethyl bacteriochlorophyllide A dehydrogenase
MVVMNDPIHEPDPGGGARALWTTGRGRCEIREQPLRSPGSDADQHVLVQTRFSGISRGSEALVFHGRVPPTEYERMRAPFQRGGFPFPIQYGYSCVGTVVEGPDALIGRPVFCLHPHQDRFRVSADAVLPVPNAVPPKRAILAANAETALNAIWDAGVSAGDRITVVGGGVVGLLVLWLAARLPAAEVTLVDLDPARRSLAEAFGAGFALPADAPGDQDRVFHCSGQPAGLQTAIDAAGFEAEIIELSWFGDRPVSLELGGAFHARRLTLRASQVGHVPSGRRARWSRQRRLATALSLLDDDRLDALIDSECTFDALPDRLPDLLSECANGLCHRVIYPS